MFWLNLVLVERYKGYYYLLVQVLVNAPGPPPIECITHAADGPCSSQLHKAYLFNATKKYVNLRVGSAASRIDGGTLLTLELWRKPLVGPPKRDRCSLLCPSRHPIHTYPRLSKAGGTSPETTSCADCFPPTTFHCHDHCISPIMQP